MAWQTMPQIVCDDCGKQLPYDAQTEARTEEHLSNVALDQEWLVLRRVAGNAHFCCPSHLKAWVKRCTSSEILLGLT